MTFDLAKFWRNAAKSLTKEQADVVSEVYMQELLGVSSSVSRKFPDHEARKAVEDRMGSYLENKKSDSYNFWKRVYEKLPHLVPKEIIPYMKEVALPWRLLLWIDQGVPFSKAQYLVSIAWGLR
jgi:hypothetical protein